MKESEKKEPEMHLAFNLEDEVFAIEIAHIREVLEPREFTRIPYMPDFIRGAVNVRGSVEMVVDMRGVLGMPRMEVTDASRVVILETSFAGEIVALGALVDSVNSVTKIHPDRIEAPPETAGRWRSELIKGIGGVDDRFIIILDVMEIHAFIESSL